jgi:uncharacterized SAM-binding protein YcdF (DUF218 family)
VLLFLGFVAVPLAWAALARAFAPTGNTAATRFDALIVLGAPADRDGNPSPAIIANVSEAVREYERGVAPHIILTGGLDHRPYIQAKVMARVAESQGVPASSIFLEPEANDTIHNACYSARIMKAHGWRSAEVISGAGHLLRAGLIFSHVPIDWRAHAATPVAPATTSGVITGNALEVLKTMRYLLYARWAEPCSP